MARCYGIRVRIRERRARFYHTLLNTKSLKLDPTIIDLLPPRPLELALGDEPSTDEITEVVKACRTGKRSGQAALRLNY